MWSFNVDSMWTTEHFFQLVTITFSVDCPVPGTARLAAVEFSCPCHKNFHAHAQFLFKNFYAHWHCPELDSVSFDFLNLIFSYVSRKLDHHYHHVKLLIGPMVLGRWIIKKNLSLHLILTLSWVAFLSQKQQRKDRPNLFTPLVIP